MINPLNHLLNRRRTSAALVGLALAGGAVVGVTGVASAASDDAGDADTTAQFLQADGDADPAERQARREARQERREARQADRTEVAELLGLSTDELKEQLRDGATLADVAAAQGVEVSSVVDLISGQIDDRLASAVENGRLTQEEADEKAAEVADKVQTRVEEGRPDRGDRGDRGPRGGDATAGDEAPADGEG